MSMRKALHKFFSTITDTIIIASLVQVVVFVIDFFSASWFRECVISGLFLLGIVTNKHTGHRIVAVAAIFIIHAKRQTLCSYGALTIFGEVNIFINTVVVPLINYAFSDGLDFITADVLCEGSVETIASITTGLLLFYGTSIVLMFWKLVCTHLLQIPLWLGMVFLATQVVSSLPKLKQLSDTLLSYIYLIVLASAFSLFRIIPVILKILSSPLRVYRYIEAVAIKKRRESRVDGPLYAYRTLGASQIRLLKIGRRIPFAELQCNLIHTSFDEAPKYTAISYAWGDAIPTHEALIDGCRVPISSTVYDILDHQRSYVEENIIWIDSICINQSDNEEKAKQVMLMRDIFHRASGVLAWLGKTQHSFRTFMAIAGLFGKRDDYSKSMQEIIRKEYLFRDDKGWEALSSFLKQPWFSRVWVIQEIAVAQNVRIVYGNIVIPWDVLEEFLEFIINNFFLFHALEMENEMIYFGPEEVESGRGAVNGNRIARLRRLRKIQQHTSLYHVLRTCPYFRSSDPRDRVYALLGLTTDGSHENVFPDYVKSIESVYTEAMRFMLTQDGSAICMLLRAGLGYPREFGALPSWVPDFSADKPTLFTIGVAQVHRTGASHIPTMRLFRDRPEVLALKGTIIGKVEHIGPTFRLNELPAPPMSLRMTEGDPKILYLKKWFRETMSLVQSYVRDPYPTGESLHEVLWRTFVGDVNEQAQELQPPASSHIADAFGDFKWAFGIDSEGLPGVVTGASGAIAVEDAVTHLARVANGKRFQAAFFSCILGMRLCITVGGSLAVVPPYTQPGDLVCAIWGATAPYLLRRLDIEPLEGGEDMVYYNLVGCCYMHGVMNGEIERVEEEEKWFFLL